jgi:hypothetical protein
MQQEPSDIRSAWFVFEGRVPAFEGYFPGVRLSAQRILVLVSLSVVSGLLSRFHNSCHPYGGKKNLPVSGSLPSGRDTDFTDSHGLSP